MAKVAILAVAKNNKWLFMRRADSDERGGLWEFPGGTVEVSESVEQAIKREMKEETGLDVNSISLIGKSAVKSAKDPSITHELYHFVCTDFSGNLKISEEHSEYKWASKEEMTNTKDISPGTLNHLKFLK